LIVGHREIFKGREGGVLFSSFFFFSRDIANQGFAIFPVKVRKYIIKVLLCKYFCITLISTNANISVNEQPEWFHWAHRR
jgi:hypothetical protein